MRSFICWKNQQKQAFLHHKKSWNEIKLSPWSYCLLARHVQKNWKERLNLKRSLKSDQINQFDMVHTKFEEIWAVSLTIIPHQGITIILRGQWCHDRRGGGGGDVKGNCWRSGWMWCGAGILMSWIAETDENWRWTVQRGGSHRFHTADGSRGRNSFNSLTAARWLATEVKSETPTISWLSWRKWNVNKNI